MNTRMTEQTRSFGRRLAEIRNQSQDQRARDLERRANASITRAERIITALRQVEQAEQVIRKLAGELTEELSPDACIERRFFDGRWMISLRLDELWMESDGRPRQGASQVSFLLDAPADTGRVSIECRTTVRCRDLPVDRLAAAPTDEDGSALSAFVERCLLAFAAAWFERIRPDAPDARLVAA